MSVTKKIFAKLKAHGLGGLLGAAWRRLPRRPLACYRICRPFVQNKVGLEIGGPSQLFKRWHPLPAYPAAARIDNCNFAHRTVWEGDIAEEAGFRFDRRRALGRQYVAEATDLGQIASASYDFVLSSNALEHIANPLQALSEWVRVLKAGGLLVLVVPHKDGTFDHRRPVTALAHLIQDFERGTDEADLTHLDEILRLHDLSQDPEAGDFEAFRQRSERNLENRCLHHHVFDTRLAVEVVDHMGLQILAVEPFRPYNILVAAQKPMPGLAVRNDPFLAVDAPPAWRSPFPSDRLP